MKTIDIKNEELYEVRIGLPNQDWTLLSGNELISAIMLFINTKAEMEEDNI